MPTLWRPEAVGVTQYVTVTTKEYALMQRMEGAVKTLLARAPSYGEETHAARAVLKDTLDQLAKSRNGGKPHEHVRG
jgi:hypothetical protein